MNHFHFSPCVCQPDRNKHGARSNMVATAGMREGKTFTLPALTQGEPAQVRRLSEVDRNGPGGSQFTSLPYRMGTPVVSVDVGPVGLTFAKAKNEKGIAVEPRGQDARKTHRRRNALVEAVRVALSLPRNARAMANDTAGGALGMRLILLSRNPPLNSAAPAVPLLPPSRQ